MRKSLHIRREGCPVLRKEKIDRMGRFNLRVLGAGKIEDVIALNRLVQKWLSISTAAPPPGRAAALRVSPAAVSYMASGGFQRKIGTPRRTVTSSTLLGAG